MKNNRRKGQIKFGETFGIIILVYIIVMVGMMWYNNINTKDINEMLQDDRRDRSFEKYYYIVNSNLLHKSEAGDIDEELDLVSLRIFSNFSNSTGKEFIRKQLGESTILIEIRDFCYNSIENITLYNNTPNGTLNVEKFKTLIPVISPINQTTYLGVLSVIVYDKIRNY